MNANTHQFATKPVNSGFYFEKRHWSARSHCTISRHLAGEAQASSDERIQHKKQPCCQVRGLRAKIRLDSDILSDSRAQRGAAIDREDTLC